MTSSTAGTQEYTEVVGGPFRTFKPTVSTRTVTWTINQAINKSINRSINQSFDIHKAIVKTFSYVEVI